MPRLKRKFACVMHTRTCTRTHSKREQGDREKREGRKKGGTEGVAVRAVAGATKVLKVLGKKSAKRVWNTHT